MGILEKIFGNYSEKELKRITPIIKKIADLESTISPLSDEELTGKTAYFKEKLANGETLDDILPEAFAVVREAGKRVLGMRHFDTQLTGGIILHQGRIAEMRTGEGKTLVSTAPAYLNALAGEGVHIVTVNDYLAKRDSDWMGKIHRFLGLSVGVILNDMTNEQRQEAYNCDITYATNNELGFDYLRDNMVTYKEKMCQRPLYFAVIDEVDSVLIDEARTPLIISGSGTKSTALYGIVDKFAKHLTRGRAVNEDDALNPLIRAELIEEGDFIYDEKKKSVNLTQEGMTKAERHFAIENLADPENAELQHYINNALRANFSMHLDKDYVVQEGEIVIVDEFTGRLMNGRRYSDGLHQAIEAKEGVEVQKSSKTLATVTFQNFFNKYKKKSGMTGTAITEEGEFREIYGMDVVTIPTNRPIQRIDRSDLVYRTEAAKLRAVVRDTKEAYEKGQPVLVGTVTIEQSEVISKLLKKEGVKHQVLNAKYHEQEAEIVSRAGEPKAVTIATNMAGRGTDIKLGEGVSENGGLLIIGTERHESRRIDNQLRGRAGRQGDPGESRFYISLEDDLMRLFGAEKVMKLIDSMGMDEDEPIENGMLTKAIENAQKRVEANNFGIRKHLLDYDQVMNEQREVIYSDRMRVLSGEDLREQILSMTEEVIERIVMQHTAESEFPEEWDIKMLNFDLLPIFHRPMVVGTDEDIQKLERTSFLEELKLKAREAYSKKEEGFEPEQIREIERVIMLKVIDQHWMNHIDDMDRMRQGISLRAYAQRDPLTEYKFISYEMFEELSNRIQNYTVRGMFNVKIVEKQTPKREEVAKAMFTNQDRTLTKGPVKREENKVGRNDPCPCGSGEKYKNCHGAS